MTKKEFQESPEPLVMIVALNPDSGKVIYDTYSYDTADGWVEDIKKDFPTYLVFQVTNLAGIKRRKELFGLTETDTALNQ